MRERSNPLIVFLRKGKLAEEVLLFLFAFTLSMRVLKSLMQTKSLNIFKLTKKIVWRLMPSLIITVIAHMIFGGDSTSNCRNIFFIYLSLLEIWWERTDCSVSTPLASLFFFLWLFLAVMLQVHWRSALLGRISSPLLIVWCLRQRYSIITELNIIQTSSWAYKYSFQRDCFLRIIPVLMALFLADIMLQSPSSRDPLLNKSVREKMGEYEGLETPVFISVVVLSLILGSGVVLTFPLSTSQDANTLQTGFMVYQFVLQSLFLSLVSFGLVFALLRGKRNYILKRLKRVEWAFYGRLSLGALINHSVFLKPILSLMKVINPDYFSVVDYLGFLVAIVTLSYLLSLLCYLFVEYPFFEEKKRE